MRYHCLSSKHNRKCARDLEKGQTFTLPNLMTVELIEEVFLKKVLRSPSDKDADQFIAELADEDTIGILSQDSDFLIYQYPKHVKYLSMDNFKFEALFEDKVTLETVAYSREELANHLDSVAKDIDPRSPTFQVGHLPVFACLKGNDVIPIWYLYGFLNKIMGFDPNAIVDHHDAIRAVAQFICKERIDPELPSFEYITELSHKIFGNEEFTKKLDYSISSYFLHQTRFSTAGSWRLPQAMPEALDEDPQSLNLSTFNWKILTNFVQSGSEIHNIMTGGPWKLPTLLEDPTSLQMPTNAQLMAPFRKRCYTILLHEKPTENDANHRVDEWCMHKIVPQEVDIALENHPGLAVLWNIEEHSANDIRWRLFSYIISPNLDASILQNLPEPDFIYPVCQLLLMQHDWQIPLLYKWEVQLFLLQHLKFKKLTDEDFQEISHQKIVPDPRGVHLAAIYTHGKLDFASKLVRGIVKMKDLMPLYSSFDGIHFQNLYLSCKEDCSVESVANLEEMNSIQKYYDIITLDGNVVREIEQ